MKDLIQQAPELFHDVRIAPTEDIMPGFEINPEHSQAVITNIGGTERVVRLVSDNYVLTPNKEILQNLATAFGSEDLKIASYTYSKGAQFQAWISIGSQKMAIDAALGDYLGASIRFENSYNGRVKFGFSLGLLRLVCTNGMTSMEQAFHSKRTRHTEAVTSKIAAEHFAEAWESNSEKFLELNLNAIRDFRANAKAMPGDMAEKDEEFLADIGQKAGFPKRQLEEVFDRIYVETESLKTEPDGWIAYNGFNYVLNHNRDILLPEHKRDVIDLKIREALTA